MKHTLLPAVLLTSLLLSSCTTPNTTSSNLSTTDTISVVTSISPIYSIASQLLDSQATVTNIIPPLVSEHVWTPTPSDLTAIANADVLIVNGGLDQAVLDIANKLPPEERPAIINTSVRLEGVAQEMLGAEEHEDHHEEGEDHEEGHHHHEGINPHYWLSPTLASQQVTYVAQELQTLYPEHARSIQEQEATLLQELTALAEEIRTDLAALELTPFLDFHEAYPYFYHEFGLEPYHAGSIEEFPGKTPTIAELQDLYQTIEEKEVRHLFIEPQFASKFVETIQEEFPDLHVYTLNPTGQELRPDELQRIMGALRDSFVSSYR